MTRLINCCDGTWNTSYMEDNGVAAPTNGYKLCNLLAPQNENAIEQRRYYQPVVGTDGWWDSFKGGALGIGLDEKITNSYLWLGLNYETGDEIYIFGFSRCALVARCLSGDLDKGLINFRIIPAGNIRDTPERSCEKVYSSKSYDIPNVLRTEFGADNVFRSNAGEAPTRSIRHAVGLDEIRASFTVTIWSNTRGRKGFPTPPDIPEVWFPRVRDTGGGYAYGTLSSGPVFCIMTEEQVKGPAFKEGPLAVVEPCCDPRGELHDSFKGNFAKLPPRPRNIPFLSKQSSPSTPAIPILPVVRSAEGSSIFRTCQHFRGAAVGFHWDLCAATEILL